MTHPSGIEEKSLWTVRDVIRWMTGRFSREGIASARLDAELLCAQALGCDRVGIYLSMDRPLSAQERASLRDLVRRRLARVPVAYLTGSREFFGLSLQVTPAVLIPRPDTETLVEAALEAFPVETPIEILDVGTGSGAIALALAHARRAWRVTATDISADALEVARENAQKLQLNIELLQGDLFEPAAGRRFHMIVSNPPYIPEGETLQPEIRHEPPSALFSGADGLSHLRRIVREAPLFLQPGGLLLCEFGAGQEMQLENLARDAGAYGEIRILRDLGGLPRVLSAKLK